MKVTDLENIRGLDLYLLDQILKGNLHTKLNILDAGCGTGRNLVTLHKLGFHISGFDPNLEVINDLKSHLPSLASKLLNTSIEDFPPDNKYDYIIVNAVLHFATSHHHFEALFNKISNLLAPNAQLLIRMTSQMATNKPFQTNPDGIAFLPDQSFRYLIEYERLCLLMQKNKLHWVEPIKTVNVANLRCMSAIILQRDSQ